jgi:hypothetical protein
MQPLTELSIHVGFAAARAVGEYDGVDLRRCRTRFSATGRTSPEPATRTGAAFLCGRFDPAARRHLAFRDLGPIARETLRREFCDVYIEHVTGAGRHQRGIWVGLR